MAGKKHLIIGAGAAALSALEEIRRLTREDEVTLVTGEDCLPYSPASLSYLLSGKIGEAELWRRDENYFRSLQSTLVRGKEVVRVMPELQRVVYSDGSADNYDRLLIASGAAPAAPPIPGWEEVDAHDFRTLADCRRLRQRLAGKRRVTILGAGIGGLHVAAALLAQGHRVTVIEQAPAILPLCFTAEAAGYIGEMFTEQQACILTGQTVQAVRRTGGEIRITLARGEALATDILINATGAKSRVSFLAGTGLGINEGILVDRKMQTSLGRIYAAGDVAEAQDFFTGKPRLSAILPSAVSQGRIAGANMAGSQREYAGSIPVTVFNFLGKQAFSLGLSMPGEQGGYVLQQRDAGARRFRKLVFQGERLVGGMFVNEPVDPGIILSLIQRRVDMTPFKEALFGRTKPLSDPWLNFLKFASGPEVSAPPFCPG